MGQNFAVDRDKLEEEERSNSLREQAQARDSSIHQGIGHHWNVHTQRHQFSSKNGIHRDKCARGNQGPQTPAEYQDRVTEGDHLRLNCPAEMGSSCKIREMPQRTSQPHEADQRK